MSAKRLASLALAVMLAVAVACQTVASASRREALFVAQSDVPRVSAGVDVLAGLAEMASVDPLGAVGVALSQLSAATTRTDSRRERTAYFIAIQYTNPGGGPSIPGGRSKEKGRRPEAPAW